MIGTLHLMKLKSCLHTAALVAAVSFLASCQHSERAQPAHRDDRTTGSLADAPKHKGDTVRILWREIRYDADVQDTVSAIVLNNDYLSRLPDPERAALGYVATFIGTDCQWDGGARDDRSNLKCMLISALGLGYQCSEQHLGFLRKWFRSDKKVLAALQDCPTTPFTASSQETFDSIGLINDGGELRVFFAAAGMNMQTGDSWNYSETDYFQTDGSQIRMLHAETSGIERQKTDPEE